MNLEARARKLHATRWTFEERSEKVTRARIRELTATVQKDAIVGEGAKVLHTLELRV